MSMELKMNDKIPFVGDTLPKLKAAAVQTAPVFLNREATIDKIEEKVKEAKANGAEKTYLSGLRFEMKSTPENPTPYNVCVHVVGVFEAENVDTDQDMQTLLTPVPVNLSPEEKQACLDNMPLLEKSGFEIDDYGMSSLAVRSAPVYLDEEDIPYVLSDMAQKLLSGIKPGSPILDELLKSIACKAAVKGGSFSGINEMQSLAEKVLKLPDVRNCPHGRPVAVSLSRRSLEKQFKRVL